MKKIILISFAVALATANLCAQTKKVSRITPEQLAEKITVKLSADLALSDVQKAKVKEVILKREKQREESIRQFERSREVFKEANKISMKAAEDELKTILTPEQMKKLAQHKKDTKQKPKKTGASPSSTTSGNEAKPPAQKTK